MQTQAVVPEAQVGPGGRLRAGLNAASRSIHALLDFVYPPRCLVCEVPLRPEDVLCASCIADAPSYPMTAGVSHEHLASLSYSADARAMFVAFEFEPGGGIAETIHAMKYRGLHRMARWLGRVIGERCVGSELLGGDPLLVPVPLHPVKQLERGYNQAAELCRGIADETGLALVPDALRRARYTASQAAMKLDLARRKSNTLNAFEVHPQRVALIRERPVIVVDDLITTGATISECAFVLREQGSPEVRLLAAARPPKAE